MLFPPRNPNLAEINDWPRRATKLNSIARLNHTKTDRLKKEIYCLKGTEEDK